MATDSIFHTIHLGTAEEIEAFLNALEESKNAPEPKVEVSYHEMTDEDIDRLFGDLKR
ncbi:MAG: hypothetical protein IJQ81_07610 [Oscillibacter sp.]|nr:hypothetical protein [Oscillibacter sp.]